jgi:hypothetical protein
MVDPGNRIEGLSHSARVTILLAVAAVMLGAVVLLLPAYMATRVRPRADPCTSSLKQLFYACQLYGGDNDGLFPPDLAALYPDYLSDPDLFVCGRLRRRRKLLPHDASRHGPLPPERISFCYVSGLRADDAPETLLAFGEEWSHDGTGVIALAVNGQFNWEKNIDALHARLEERLKALREQGREVKVIRPPWSRWPERPQYPPVPWDRRKAVPALVVGAAALVVILLGVLLFPPWKRRRA